MKIRSFVLSIVILSLALPVGAQRTKRTEAPKARHVDLSKEKVGGESSKFLSVVGNWIIVEDGGKKCLAVDGNVFDEFS